MYNLCSSLFLLYELPVLYLLNFFFFFRFAWNLHLFVSDCVCLSDYLYINTREICEWFHFFFTYCLHMRWKCCCSSVYRVNIYISSTENVPLIFHGFYLFYFLRCWHISLQANICLWIVIRLWSSINITQFKIEREKTLMFFSIFWISFFLFTPKLDIKSTCLMEYYCRLKW